MYLKSLAHPLFDLRSVIMAVTAARASLPTDLICEVDEVITN